MQTHFGGTGVSLQTLAMREHRGNLAERLGPASLTSIRLLRF